jgi:hypothetical protein
MSVLHHEGAGQPSQPTVRSGTLLRRLMIRCPATGRASDTGYDLSALPSVAGRRQLLVDCLECGQDHDWSVDDVFLD